MFCGNDVGGAAAGGFTLDSWRSVTAIVTLVHRRLVAKNCLRLLK